MLREAFDRRRERAMRLYRVALFFSLSSLPCPPALVPAPFPSSFPQSPTLQNRPAGIGAQRRSFRPCSVGVTAILSAGFNRIPIMITPYKPTLYYVIACVWYGVLYSKDKTIPKYENKETYNKQIHTIRSDKKCNHIQQSHKREKCRLS